MIDSKEPLLALFHHAFGPTLSALVKPQAGPLALSDALWVATEPALAHAGEHEDAMLAAVLSWLWTRNQFVELDEDSQAELADFVESTLDALHKSPTRDAVQAAMTAFRDDLAGFVRTRYGNAPREVVSAEYTPELQLQVLGLRLEVLAQPLLDIGCGPSAALVRYLRDRGVQAQGIDRAVSSELAVAADWLSFPYEKHRPGMAISHLGFSLHFLHHHLTGSDKAFVYARAYMSILRALKPLGSFCYTPGLPFIESMLDAKLYRVQHVPFASELQVASLKQIEASTGLSLSHATHVARVR